MSAQRTARAGRHLVCAARWSVLAVLAVSVAAVSVAAPAVATADTGDDSAAADSAGSNSGPDEASESKAERRRRKRRERRRRKRAEARARAEAEAKARAEAEAEAAAQAEAEAAARAQAEAEAAAQAEAEAAAQAEADAQARAEAEAAERMARRPPARRRRFYVRAGVLRLQPFPQSGEVELSNVGGAASLAVDNGPIEGSRATIDPVTIPAAIVGYVTPWMDGRLSVETILGTPVTIKFGAAGTIAEESLAPEALGIPTGVPALGTELGETKAIPPIVTMVYRFRHDMRVRPYAGAGLSVLFAYDSKITNPLMNEVAEPEFEVPPAFGVVTQGGVEARLGDRYFVDLDLKFIALMKSKGTVKNIHMRTPGLPLFDTVRVGDASVTVTVNPLIVQLGAGLEF